MFDMGILRRLCIVIADKLYLQRYEKQNTIFILSWLEIFGKAKLEEMC